jgi:hypothetical protein
MSDHHDAKFGEVYRMARNPLCVIMIIDVCLRYSDGTTPQDFDTVYLSKDSDERPDIDRWGMFSDMWERVDA